ncbi:auxin-responsive protein IAA14-like [Rhodamnia argentea]|uniref:Auxin-responsive protein n=1 Tax=Rhodamnia argentea TaxID=178133 RepID=A0A8B8MSB1_9MYRT|nr:auxin-responsive protein IAA14-like [Rhodamnia argentea]XP_048134272.1 auxin-responsive protein IAA14-like [Rhodamnia argentea]XP_048134273.1 auxin-responsive protein IAA14-like [Rhodamnia argentea]XP_048134274.1 auxin-responsive protein IAA14-like [Rhodamnia argentea]
MPTKAKEGCSGNNKTDAGNDKNLDLRLSPPGESFIHGAKRVFEDTVTLKARDTKLLHKHPCPKAPSTNQKIEELADSRTCWPETTTLALRRVIQELKTQSSSSYKPFSLTSPPKVTVGKSSQEGVFNEADFLNLNSEALSSPVILTGNAPKRIPPGPVVGWPPIASFRKNVANNFLCGQTPELSSKNVGKQDNGERQSEDPNQHMFVKIYMDGFPIGRKLNLKAYDSYEKLSVAIYELFRGLLAAQSAIGDETNTEREDRKAENGECTLVYDDNEGDRILVGDVPWNMFVSTAKRLRILKSSGHTASPPFVSSDQGNTPLDSAATTGK